MTAPTPNTVTWFEIATDDPETAERFYGSLFGWTFESDAGSAEGGMDYRMINYPGGGRPAGGLFNTAGELPPHGVFTIAVDDLTDTCERVEKLGGKVVFSQTETKGGPPFAYVQDPAGNLFGLFTPVTAAP
jgi:predicted enzyme related to lactoylglutathione lyase